MRKLLLILTLLISTITVSQDKTVKENKLKEISGIVTSQDYPLENVSIIIKNTQKGTATNKKGFYKIKAKSGDILKFTHINMKSIEILIEDVTTVLNINMRSKENILEEVTVKSKKPNSNKKPKSLSFNNLNIDTRRAGYSIGYIKGEKLNSAAITIGRALQGRIAGFKLVIDDYGNEYAKLRSTSSLELVKYALWDVDGVIYEYAPPLDLDNIKEVAVLRSLAGVNKYGSEGIGGVIIINTKSAFFAKAKNIKSKENPYTNKDYYNDDAVGFEDAKTGKPNYLAFFKKEKTPELAYKKYQNIYAKYYQKTNFHLNSANFFIDSIKSKLHALKILEDYNLYSKNNPEKLKSLAYKYQELRLHNKALEIYKKLIKIRPNHAQSYRDIANTYTHLKQYKNAWKIYKYYLQKGFKIKENAIGDIISTEMNAIYITKKKEAKIKETLVLQKNDSIIKNDIRLVFEWNTSEAEFIFEFVNPDKQSYKIDHSLAENSQLILDEKQVGYNSKEFKIEDLGEGDWLVNITYLGNKKYDPTFLKVTTYYNWGEKNQREKIKVYELNLKDVKTKLLTLNKNKL